MSYDVLFRPLQIGGCTVPNRIARTAHSTGTVGEELIAYHEERARGGVGLTIIEIAGVQSGSATSIPVFSDRVVPFYAELAGRMHAHGTQVFQQLWHGGAAYGRAGQPVSASAVPAPSINLVPRPMTKAMIDDTVAAFAAAAVRCRDGGLDGVELHGAHGYLIGQSLISDMVRWPARSFANSPFMRSMAQNRLTAVGRVPARRAQIFSNSGANSSTVAAEFLMAPRATP